MNSSYRNIDCTKLNLKFGFSRSRKTNVSGSTVTKRPLPYWVAAVSKAEKFDPELQKFVAEDKYYKEEEDPDYVLPATDDDTGTEEEEAEGEEQLYLLNSEANNDLPEDIKDGKYK